MKKSYFGGLLLLVAMLGISNAQAGMITDIIDQNVKLNWLQSHSYTHDINDDGFVYGSALSGTLEIDVYDDNVGPTVCLFGCLTLPDGPEVVLFTIEDFDFDTGAITFGDFSGGLEFEALASLNTDGLLDVTVTSLIGDFYVGQSLLTVYTEDPAVDVPEPSTLALLGLGLVGLGICRRKAKA